MKTVTQIGFKEWPFAVMFFMLVTELTFHLEMSQLKLDAILNMYSIFVTRPTSHLEMLELKLFAKKNKLFISVTSLTHHDPISP